MLTECRKALRITTTAYDGELCSLMKAGAADLRTAGVVIPGTVNFKLVTTTSGQTTTSYWEDAGTLKDDLVMRAIFTYADWLFYKDAPNQEAKQKIYELQKVQLMHASAYTDYESGGDC